MQGGDTRGRTRNHEPFAPSKPYVSGLNMKQMEGPVKQGNREGKRDVLAQAKIPTTEWGRGKEGIVSKTALLMLILTSAC